MPKEYSTKLQICNNMEHDSLSKFLEMYGKWNAQFTVEVLTAKTLIFHLNRF